MIYGEASAWTLPSRPYTIVSVRLFLYLLRCLLPLSQTIVGSKVKIYGDSTTIGSPSRLCAITAIIFFFYQPVYLRDLPFYSVYHRQTSIFQEDDLWRSIQAISSRLYRIAFQTVCFLLVLLCGHSYKCMYLTTIPVSFSLATYQPLGLSVPYCLPLCTYFYSLHSHFPSHHAFSLPSLPSYTRLSSRMNCRWFATWSANNRKTFPLSVLARQQ